MGLLNCKIDKILYQCCSDNSYLEESLKIIEIIDKNNRKSYKP